MLSSSISPEFLSHHIQLLVWSVKCNNAAFLGALPPRIGGRKENDRVIESVSRRIMISAWESESTDSRFPERRHCTRRGFRSVKGWWINQWNFVKGGRGCSPGWEVVIFRLKIDHLERVSMLVRAAIRMLGR